ncbi:Uu.00g085030.m01.CDS01 [Anthostomella pinea]|uniref:Uu.00g085030.m01.CDS01 n=1 Tax=Anthostomella pinea TaxID=933095 RepID=A0AAI8VMI8_9PEZI|nr:Uu.00g085030.m01.CDS01 [Anthostomella pinea]
MAFFGHCTTPLLDFSVDQYNYQHLIYLSQSRPDLSEIMPDTTPPSVTQYSTPKNGVEAPSAADLTPKHGVELPWLGESTPEHGVEVPSVANLIHKTLKDEITKQAYGFFKCRALTPEEASDRTSPCIAYGVTQAIVSPDFSVHEIHPENWGACVGFRAPAIYIRSPPGAGEGGDNFGDARKEAWEGLQKTLVELMIKHKSLQKFIVQIYDYLGEGKTFRAMSFGPVILKTDNGSLKVNLINETYREKYDAWEKEEKANKKDKEEASKWIPTRYDSQRTIYHNVAGDVIY